MEEKKYPIWIDEYAKSIHNAFSNMVPGTWGPVDIFDIFEALNGKFIQKLFGAIQEIKKQDISLKEVGNSFSNPSALRGALMYLVYHYQLSDKKLKKEFKEVIEFLVSVLQEMVREDIFCYSSNIIHSSQEVKELIENRPFEKASPEKARELGKFYNSISSLTYALYRDFFPQIAFEIYRPYDVSNKFGENSILVIKEFMELRPKEIWPKIEDYDYQNIKIYQVYKNVKFECELIGMHSIYEGDIINDLTHYIVEVNGEILNDIETIKKIGEDVANLVVEQVKVYDEMNFDELKEKSLEWEGYQFKKFFELAGMNWQPDQKMVEVVKKSKIGERLRIEKFPSLKDFSDNPENEIFWLKDLYR